MKKKLIITVMLVLSLFATAAYAADTKLELGDYIQLGTYYNVPVLWRCSTEDENGQMILSDRIICLKAYDAAGEHENDYKAMRKRFGCNLWETSSIRTWLNSDKPVGEVEWTGSAPSMENVWNGHNSYDKEAGFLTNFTAGELRCMKATEQKNLLNVRDLSKSTSGSEGHISYATKIYSILQNYDNAYSYKLTDKVFLMDVKQVNEVYNNREILGDDYFIGVPTEECIKNSEYTMGANSSNPWHCWLRSPYANRHAETTRHIWRDGGADREYPYASYLGVRPAFYLDLENADIVSGDGSIEKPYRLK